MSDSKYRYTEIPTDLLLDVHDLVIGCNRNLAIDENEDVVVTLDPNVTEYLPSLTKWVEYAAAELLRKADLDCDTAQRLIRRQSLA